MCSSLETEVTLKVLTQGGDELLLLTAYASNYCSCLCCQRSLYPTNQSLIKLLISLSSAFDVKGKDHPFWTVIENSKGDNSVSPDTRCELNVLVQVLLTFRLQFLIFKSKKN